MDEPYYYERMHISTIAELVDITLALYPDKGYCQYIVGSDIVTKTYGDLKSDIAKIESYLVRSGARHVGLLGATSYEWLSVLMACLHSGIVAVPLDALLPDEDLAYLIGHADVDLLFCDTKFSALSQQLGSNDCCETVRFLDADGEGSLRFEMDEQTLYDGPPVLNKDDLALIVYTSGTTGHPKGVMLSQGNLAAATYYSAAVVDPVPNSRMLVVLPNNHVYTITIIFLTGFFFARCMCLNDSIYHTMINLNRFDANRLVAVPAVVRLLKGEIDKQLLAQGITSLESLPPEQRTAIVAGIKQHLGKLHSIVCGGAPLDASYVHFFKLLGIQLQLGYGMAEAAPLISSQVENRIDYHRAHSVGRPGVCCEVDIVDGEIWVKGANVMLGYYKDPVSTADIITDDGWLKTGDLGYIDEEGFLYVTGRKKNLIILGNGENVSPEELEMLFADSRLIQDILVSGNSDLDIIQADIYPLPATVNVKGLEETKVLINQEISDKNQNLPLYKQIKLVTFRDQPFETTTSMKIKR